MTNQVEYRSTHLLPNARLKFYRYVTDGTVNAGRVPRSVVDFHRPTEQFYRVVRRSPQDLLTICIV